MTKKASKPQKTPAKNTRGRPTVYTKAIGDAICARLSTGETLRSICRDDGFPPESTVRQWALDNVQGFYAQYVRARDIGLDAMADEIIDIADTPHDGVTVTEKVGGIERRFGDMVEHRKLRVDTRKWYLSKLAPKRYDKPDLVTDDDNAAQPVKVVVNVVDASKPDAKPE